LAADQPQEPLAAQQLLPDAPIAREVHVPPGWTIACNAIVPTGSDQSGLAEHDVDEISEPDQPLTNSEISYLVVCPTKALLEWLLHRHGSKKGEPDTERGEAGTVLIVASSASGLPPEQAAPIKAVTEKRLTSGKQVRKNVNARMIEKITQNHEAMGWTSPEWARQLTCAKSSVVATRTWKDLTMARERKRAERARDRRRGKTV